MPRHTVKFFNAPLVLASLALVMPISAATAADIQQQMRELLTGTQTTHFVAQPGPREAKVATSAVDSQGFAKQLLLGTAAYGGGGSETSRTGAQHRPVASIDMQAAVRHLLLGQPHAADAS